MSSKLNVETFVAVLKKSNLIEAERLHRLVTEYTAQGGVADDSPKLADYLVAQGAITRWQSEKLLQGKHKGYFLGKYRLLSLLGKGGMSSVYLAEHVLMRRRCALKVLPTKRVHDSSYLARFHREAQAVASLDHPNIVRAYDVDQQADRDTEIHFLVMEYVEGYSLQELVQKNGQCSYFDSAEYIRQAALGLHNAHEAGMVHRDVKPGNLLVDPNGVVKVLDLGLARFFTGDEGEDALTIRHDEKVLGTADYLAPEQALDSHTVDARADIYSLGCTFYFLLTGRPPFTEGTLAQRLMAHQTKTPAAVENFRPDIPPSLAAILRKMMAKKPDERFPTAKDAAETLFNWIDANADPEWRRLHSGIFGNRSTEMTGSRGSIPVAQPIVAMPVATVVTPPVAAPPVFQPPPAAAPPAPQFVAGPAPETTPVDAELTNFFAALSDSQNIARVKPESSPKQPAPKQPAPKQVPPQSTIFSAAAPPHLKPLSSLDLKSALPPAPTEPTFPDFSSLSTTPTAPVPIQQPVAPTTPATGTKIRKSIPIKLPVQLPIKLPASLPLPLPVLAGIGGGVALLLIIVVAYAMGMFGGSGGSGKKPDVVTTPWAADKREVTVGEGGEYKTINDALRAVRRRFEPTGAPTDQMVIKVAAGTYTENISIDGTPHRPNRKEKKSEKPVDPDWPQGIKLVADGEVILEGPPDAPAIRLKNIPRLIIEGLTIRATGKPVAVEVNGDMNDSRLSRLKISGFNQTGVACLGARGISFGNSQFILEKLTLEAASGSTSAVGIRMQSGGEGDPSDTVIRQCRLMGPMSAGVAMSGTGPYRITIVENIFTKVQDGVRFEGSAQWKDIAIANNTFHDGRNGIVFANMPADGSLGLSFRRNLFTKITSAEGVVQSGYNEGKLGGMLTSDRPGWELNYSDRAKPATPLTGEIVPLLANNGKQGEAGFAFASTDPKDAKFLAPTDKSVQRTVPGAKEGEKDFVGAVGP